MNKKDVNRNDPCPCGSGKKYKKCCGLPGKPKFKAQVLSGKGTNLFQKLIKNPEKQEKKED